METTWRAHPSSPSHPSPTTVLSSMYRSAPLDPLSRPSVLTSKQVAMTVNSRIIKTFLQCAPDAVDVPLMNGLRVQILPTIDDLPKARKHQFAAFIASEALLIVWDDEAMNIINRAKAIENELMQLVWKTGEAEEEAEQREQDQQEHGHARTALLGAGGVDSVNREATHAGQRSGWWWVWWRCGW